MDATARTGPELASEALDVATDDGTADAFLTRPARGEPFPAVILHMDAYGIRPALLAHAERLARHGYCVFVPNAFYRDRRSPVADDLEARMQSEDRAALFADLMPMIRALTPAAVTADARAWLTVLREHPDAAA